MFFFPVYAVIAWALAFRFRRKWKGAGVVALSVLGLIGLAWVHWKLSVITHGRVYLPILQMLLYPYIVLVAFGGVFVAAMPRRPGRGQCHACGYGLAGLEAGHAGVVCPECGAGAAVPRSVVLQVEVPRVVVSAEHGAVDKAEPEDQERDAREERDAEHDDRPMLERLHDRRALSRGAAGDQVVLTREPVHP